MHRVTGSPVRSPASRHHAADPWPALRASVTRWACGLTPPLPAVAGCCTVCRGPVQPGYTRCYQCDAHDAAAPGMLADVVVPICYAIKGTRYADALWRYKSAAASAAAALALRTLLLVFLREHGRCVWRHAGMSAPTHLAVVPSGRGRPGVHPLRTLLASYLLLPWAVLTVRGEAEPSRRELDVARFRAGGRLTRASVLLVDDSWVSGASAQSAAVALRLAGARHVATVVLGRHVNPVDPHAPQFLDSLIGTVFDVGGCAVHPAISD